MKLLVALLSSSLLLLAACGGDAPAKAPVVPAKRTGDVAKLVLASQPPGAVSVLDAKKQTSSDNCVVSGRIANIVPGYAVLTLMDSSLPYCGEKHKEDGCKTPWDYCCESSETRTASSLLVEVRDDKGKPVVGNWPELRLLDAVTFSGKLGKDEHGNHVLVASGYHRDARPTLPDGLRWPK